MTPTRESVVAHPAATVILLRDTDSGVTALLVRRNAQLAFHGGAWVFPGGRLDPEDYGKAAGGDVVSAARHAAVREAWEEAGTVIEAQSLVTIARWVTPEGLPKRFDTWFFAARARTDAVRVDGGEIHEHRWMRPSDALAAQRASEIELPPPTFVTLTQLTTFHSVDDALTALRRGPVESFLPRLHMIAGGACTLYDGDVAYDSGDVDEPGPRHRLWMVESGWRYERSDVTPARAL
ncbi:MAG TPA: NUDIX hydrolase [Candidatus Acidoferrales bacterium]|nr:NUDIX hydrolase [Candidatus Acidoferrales bacterium]